MRKQLLILIANVEYAKIDTEVRAGNFLSANSYVVESMEGIDAAVHNFRSEVEQEGCRIVNFLAHIVPEVLYQ